MAPTRKNRTKNLLSRRKNGNTILGSQKLHNLYKKATANGRNKAIVAGIMTAVLGIAALFISSKGAYLESWTRMRGVLTDIPGGNKLGSLVQKLLDLVLRLLGIGVSVGSVVVPRDVDAVFLKQYAATEPRNKLPTTDQDFHNSKKAFGHENKCIVIKINNDRTMHLAKFESDSYKKNNHGDVITNKDVYGKKVRDPKPDHPFKWEIDHWKKVPSDQQPHN